MAELTNLNDILAPDRIELNVALSSKKRALQNIAALLASDTDTPLSEKDVFKLLIEREKVGNTGIGLGVALPHSRCQTLSKPVLAVMSLSEAIDYDSIDGQGVTLVFGLLVPQDANDQHLGILSQIARIVQVPGRVATIGQFDQVQPLIDAFEAWQSVT